MTITSTHATPDGDGEVAARFAREAAPFFDVLLRGARRLAVSDADAEDLVQDTLLHAYAGFHSFQEGTNLKAWLFRILHNRWISTYRFRQRRPSEISVEQVTERDLFDGADRLPRGRRSAEAEVLDALPDDDIKAAMESLSDGFRAVMFYADVQGYTYAQTAAILDIPIGTVMSRVSRGRNRLRIALAHLDGDRADLAEPRIA